MNKQTVYLPSNDDTEDGLKIFAKKTEAYVFTEEELLELRKKWAAEAFEVGIKIFSGEVAYSFDPNLKKDKLDKETYLNNLKID